MLTRLHEYELVGEGAMARVFKAVDADGRAYAIKVLNYVDDEFLALFLREVQVTARLSHRNVISIYDFGRVEEGSVLNLDAGAGFFVSNFVDGGEFNPSSIRNWSGLKRFTLELLDGLAHAHARGVVHRDLKPANILVTDPDRPRPIIADFGIAHDLSRKEEDDTLEVAGTPLFMAPEQFVDSRHVGPWSDLYSIGCILWVTATGQHLFDYPVTAAIALAHYSEDLPEFVPRFPVPEGFDEIVFGLLEKPISSRYGFAADVADAIGLLGDIEEEDAGELTLPAGAPTFIAEEAATEVVPRFDRLPERKQTKRLKPARKKFSAITVRPKPAQSVQNLELFALREPAFVGREEVVSRLSSDLKRICDQKTISAAILVGDEGVGRTRLAAEFSRRAHELGIANVWSANARVGEGVFDCLWRILRRELQLWSATAKEVEKIVVQRFPDLDTDFVEKLAGELGSETAYATAPVSKFSSSKQRLEAWIQIVEHVARDRALIIRIEDVERLSGFKPVFDTITSSRLHGVFILLSSTDAAWASDDRVINLEALDASLFNQTVGSSVQLEIETLRQLGQVTHGNIGFALRLLNHWIRCGALVLQDKGWVVVDPPSITDESELYSAIVERLRASTDITPVTVGAVLGRVVDVSEWRSTCHLLGLASPAYVLAEFDREGVIELRQTSWAFRSEGMYNAFLRQIARDQFSHFHAAALDVIRTAYRPTARGISERVAWHLAAMGKVDEARAELLAEVRRTANDADAEYCLQLLDARAALEGDETRDDDVEALLMRSQFLIPLGFQEEAVAVLNEAQRLADPNREIYAEVVRSKGVMLRNLGYYELANESLEEAVERFEKIGDEFSIARSLLGQLTVLRYLGRMDDAIDRATRCLTLMKSQDRSWKMIAEREYGRLLFQSGQTHRSKVFFLELLRRFRSQGLRYIETELLMDLGAVFQALQDYDRAIAYFEEAWDAMHAANDVNLRKADVQLAQTYALTGDIDRCCEYVQRTLKEGLTPIMEAYLAELQLIAAGLQSQQKISGNWRESLAKFDALQSQRPIVNIEIATAAEWVVSFTTEPALTARAQEIATRHRTMLRPSDSQNTPD